MKRTRLQIYTIDQRPHFNYSKQQEKNKMSKEEITVMLPAGLNDEQAPSDATRQAELEAWEKSGKLMSTAVLANLRPTAKQKDQKDQSEDDVLMPAGFGSDTK